MEENRPGRREGNVSRAEAKIQLMERAQQAEREMQELRWHTNEHEMARQDRQITELRECVEALERKLEATEPWVRGIKWALGIFGAILITFLWQILTHRIELIFH